MRTSQYARLSLAQGSNRNRKDAYIFCVCLSKIKYNLMYDDCELLISTSINLYKTFISSICHESNFQMPLVLLFVTMFCVESKMLNSLSVKCKSFYYLKIKILHSIFISCAREKCFSFRFEC